MKYLLDIKEVFHPTNSLFNPNDIRSFMHLNKENCVMKIGLNNIEHGNFKWQLTDFSYSSTLQEDDIERIFMQLLDEILKEEPDGFYITEECLSKDNMISKFRCISPCRDGIYEIH